MTGDVLCGGYTTTTGNAYGLMRSLVAEQPALQGANIVSELIEQKPAPVIVLPLCDHTGLVLRIQIIDLLDQADIARAEEITLSAEGDAARYHQIIRTFRQPAQQPEIEFVLGQEYCREQSWVGLRSSETWTRTATYKAQTLDEMGNG